MNKLIPLLLCLLAAPALADDPPPDDAPCVKDDPRPKCLFTFDPDGKVHPKDPKAERIFNFPAIKTGLILDIPPPDITIYVAVQVVHWDMLGEDFAITAGASPHRVLVTLDWEAIPIMRIGPNIWGGYNLSDKYWAYGVGFTILKF